MYATTPAETEKDVQEGILCSFHDSQAYAISFYGHKEVVQLLLGKGINMSTMDPSTFIKQSSIILRLAKHVYRISIHKKYIG